MVEIYLDKKENGNYTSGDANISIKKEDYGNQKKFGKVTYEIQYKNKYNSYWFWLWSSSYYSVYIKNEKDTIFTYYASKDLDVIEKVESYHSNTKENVPLIIGLKNKYYTKYYTYYSLKGNYSYGFPDKWFESDRSDEKLKTRLKAEDNRVNRIKFFKAGGSYKNCHLARENIKSGQKDFVKYSYTVDNNKRYDDHYLDKYEIFKHESAVIEVNESYFKTVDNQYFDEVCVYCTNEQIKRVLLLEFVNVNTGNKYFSRQDKYGYYWVQDKSISDVENGFEKIQNLFNDKISFILTKKDGSYGNGSIRVTNRTFKEYVQYIHTPQTDHQNKKSYILQNGNLITLEIISEITGNKLNDPQNQTYSSVTSFYKRVQSKELKELPFFLELHKHGTSVKYYFQRVDNQGIKWAQVTIKSDELQTDDNKRNEILKQVDYYSNKSIVILANENKNPTYPVNIIDNSSNEKSEQTQKITVLSEDCVSGSIYKSYKHDLSNVTSPRLDVNPLSSVNGLRLFVGSNSNKNVNIDPFLEIKPYDSSGVERRYLYLDVSKGDKNNIFVYLLKNNNIPLLFYHSDKFYCPKNMDEYFMKWVENKTLSKKKPCDNSEKTQFKTQLDKINKNLNQADLSRTTLDGYGIKKLGQNDEKDYYTSPDNNFNGKRINLNKESGCDKFCKLTHKTSNNQAIGRLIDNGNDLQDDSTNRVLDLVEKERSNITHNSLSAYYHKSDKTNKFPLLLGIFKSGEQNNKVFYQRVDSTPQTKWKKIEPLVSQDLQKEGEKIAEKINFIHYNIGKSVKIQVDQQDKGGSGVSYPIQLVENKDGTEGTTQSAGTNYQITVSKKGCSKPDLKGYICFTHTIPDLTNLPATYYISGLKLYICQTHYLPTHVSVGSGSLPIYYDPGHNQVKVYFYQRSSNNPDNVPLLVEYNATHYKPSSRDGYFTSWLKATIPEGDGRSDISQLPQIGNVLEEINKDLNTIQLEVTGNESYGLTKPRDTVNCGTGTTINDFCKRITVTPNDSQKQFYLMVTHITNNKGPIGNFTYRGDKIEGIKTDQLENGCNKVDVYYRADDSDYNQPLLICITSQTQLTSSNCKKWFSRQGIDVKLWNDADEGDDKFKDGPSIKAYLEQIQTKLSNYLLLSIESHKPYSAYVQKGSEGDKKPIKEISVKAAMGPSSYKADNYRYYEHNLKNYYESYKRQIQSTLSLEEQGNDLTLQVSLYIFNNYSLGLLDKDGKSELSNPLIYGKDQADRGEDFNPYVYFFESTARLEDKVPLLVKFGERYFGPKDKDNYFNGWKEYDINNYGSSGGPEKDKIKALLNQITRKLNEIKLEINNNKEYGDIKPTQRPDNPLGAKPRVTVTTQNGSNDYKSVTHSTANTGCVGYVKYGDSELQVFEGDGAGDSKPWSKAIEQELTSKSLLTTIYNDLTAYYHKTDSKFTNPLLIKISGPSGSGRTRVEDLYYERFNSTENLKWKKVIERLIDDKITEKVNQIFYDFNKSVKIKLQQHLLNGRSTSYFLKLIKNSDDSDATNSLSDGNITVSKGTYLTGNSYICIKHTTGLTHGISSQVGGIRFYFGETEAKTYDIRGSIPRSVFYDDRKKDVWVYLQESTNVPLLFRYNTQCFKPHSKENYFTKWVLEPSIKSSHPRLTDLNKIDTMLNEINLDITGNESKEQYGLDSKSISGLTEFDGKRITATRVTSDSKHYKSIIHSTINNLGIGNVKYVQTDVTENQGGQNLGDVVKKDPDISGSTVNTVTVYYHTTDNDYTTPLILGFGNKGTGDSEPAAVTPSVFYERVDNNQHHTKWVKVQGMDLDEMKKGDDSLAKKLEKIRYQIGKSLVISVENQSTDGYKVQVVENKLASGRSKGPQSISGFNQKIQVKKEDCPSTQSSESSAKNTLKGYTCYTHTIPDLKSATDKTLIGGVRFYVCKNQYLPTFGPGGYPEEHIYYYKNKPTVTVYFYSSGHGPPGPDTVPLLVTYGGKYYAPKDKSSYFTSWDRVDVQLSTEGQGHTSTGKPIKEVLDGINKNLNTVDISKTGDGGNTTYGLFKNGNNCPCSSPDKFCDRLSSKREKVTKPSSQAGGDDARGSLDTDTNTLFLKVTHTTTNKAGIGNICHHSQVITAIKPGSGTTECVQNQVEVYYDSTDKQYQTPLLICLTEQPKTQPSEPAATTKCKKWYKRKGIDINDWVEEGDTNKYGSDDKIQSELKSILDLFKDYLYLEIGSREPYTANVQHQTGPKKQVQQVEGGDGSEDKNKIKVTDAGSGEGAQVQVPKEYKRYTHGLKAFYNGAKEQIKQALKPQSTNQVPDSSDDQSQNPTLYLRLQIDGQVVTVVDTDGSPLKTPLQYKPSDAGSDSNGKKDPIVFFYKTGGTSGGSTTPDTVPLLFHYEGKYFGPKDRHSYFNTWQEVRIEGAESGDGGQTTENIKNELDKINRELNEIDLTKTGGSKEREYGLEKPGGGSLTNGFSTKRIQVERQDKVLSGTTSFTYVTHKTVNNYNIGNIKKLGSCEFDNQHTSKLSDTTHNQAVAVYTSGDTRDLHGQTPALVLICSSENRLGSGSQPSKVQGYYDLSQDCNSGGKYEFKKVNTFTVNQLTDRKTVQKSCAKLVNVLDKLGILKKEQPPAPPQPGIPDSSLIQEDSRDSPDDEEEEEAGVPNSLDTQRGNSDESQDDRPKVGGGDGGHGLGGSGVRDAGARAEPGAAGQKGDTGEQGDRGLKGNDGIRGDSDGRPAASHTQNEDSPTSPTHGHTSPTTTREDQPQRTGGDIDGGGNGGGASPGAKGPRGETAAMTDESDSGGTSENSEDPLQTILKAFENPAVSGGTGGAAGVGVIATVGVVVYKK